MKPFIAALRFRMNNFKSNNIYSITNSLNLPIIKLIFSLEKEISFKYTF